MAAEPGVPADASLSVVIVENHALYRKGLRAQFEADSAIDVVAEFDNAAEAVREVPALRPSVVLMDLHLPWSSGRRPTYCGAQAITEIRKYWPGAKIAVVTMFGDDERVRETLKAGALSFVSKDGEPHDVIQAVHLTAQGTSFLCHEAIEAVKRSLPYSKNGFTSFSELAPRENQQLNLAADGDTDRQIAERMDITAKTVANNWSNIRQKLGASSRAEAVEMAQANGFRLDRESARGPGDPG